MRDTLGALLVLGAGGGRAAGSGVVVGMSGDTRPYVVFVSFRVSESEGVSE